MKKIRIEIKDLDKNEFKLGENGEKGDYFFLNEVIDIDIIEIKNQLQSKINILVKNELNEKLANEKNNWINEFKQSEYFLKIKDDREKYKNDFENLKKNYELQRNNLINEFKLSEEYKNLENQKIHFQKDKEILELNLRNSFNSAINKLKEDYKKERDYLNDIIRQKDESLKRREIRNIKEMGEDFELWIQNEYDTYFGIDDSKCVLVKTTKIIGGTKPDFEFKILNDDGSVLESVIIEAKTELICGGKTKNSDHYEKLDKDRKNAEAQFALLVSELEPQNTFVIKKINQYENMFVIRPPYLISFLSLIKYISEQKKYINDLTINFKDKQDIINDFNLIKKEILENSIKNIEKNCELIMKNAERIISSADQISSSINTIFNTHIKTIKNKIENFKINSILSRIENIEN